jgi:hypothetical protein
MTSEIILYKQTPWPLVRKRTIQTDRPPLVEEIWCQLLLIEGCRVVSAADPLRSLISVFLTGAVIFLSSSSSFTIIRADWTPFQTHCYSENLVAPGIEPGISRLGPETMTTRPQGRSSYSVQYVESGFVRNKYSIRTYCKYYLYVSDCCNNNY